MHYMPFIPRTILPLSALLCLMHSAHAADNNNADTTANAPQQREVRVIYLPDSERQRIKEEIKREMREEMLATAEKEKWVQPAKIPQWTERISVEGDLRVRYQMDDYADRNYDPAYGFINYQAINSGAPYDLTLASGNPPITNTTQDRQRLRLKARLGVNAIIADNLQAHLRMATGGTTTSSNQTLGNDFNKMNFALDRAYFDYQPIEGANVLAGRMANPWFSTDMLWDDDVNFDGIAGKYQFDLADGIKPFVTMGAFSVENTAVDQPSYGLEKTKSYDKWLFAAQLGTHWQIKDNVNFKGALSYYYFNNIQGKQSSPCFTTFSSSACDTDASRPGFLQHGNTLFGLRDIRVVNSSDRQYQYFGLSSPFRELNATGKLDIGFDNRNTLSFTADYVKNLAFNKSRINALGPVTNLDKDGTTYKGGDQGYLLNVQYGIEKPALLGDWNVGAGYRYVESDAVVDAFNDSDFHLGGTNNKGFFISGSVGITKNAWMSLRYLSADEIVGAPYSVDVIQLDLNGRF